MTEKLPVVLEPLMDIDDVTSTVKVSRGHWYREIRRGNAPPPLKIGDASRWTPTRIRKYIADKMREAEGAQK